MKLRVNKKKQYHKKKKKIPKSKLINKVIFWLNHIILLGIISLNYKFRSTIYFLYKYNLYLFKVNEIKNIIIGINRNCIYAETILKILHD